MLDQAKPKKSPLVLIVVIVVLVAAAVVVYFLVGNKKETTNSSVQANTNKTGDANAAANSNASADSNDSLKQYDGKVVNISSTDGRVNGQLAIVYRSGEERPLQVLYFFKVNDALSKKATSYGGESYYYVAKHTKTAEIRTGTDTGVLSAVFCSADYTPDILALARAGSVDVTNYSGCAAQSDPYASTTTFYQIYREHYDYLDFDYDKIIDRDTLAVFNAAPYYTVNGTPDRNQIVSQGEITKQYVSTYAE